MRPQTASESRPVSRSAEFMHCCINEIYMHTAGLNFGFSPLGLKYLILCCFLCEIIFFANVLIYILKILGVKKGLLLLLCFVFKKIFALFINLY